MGSIVREALANLVGGVSKASVFAVLLGAVVVALAAVEAFTVLGIQSGAERFRASGGSLIVYQAPSRIDGTACDALSDTPSVVAAGAVRRAETDLTPTALPGEPVPSYEVSRGFGGFSALGRPQGHGAALVSTELARTLGVHPGGVLATSAGPLAVGAAYRYPDDGRVPGYGYAVFLPVQGSAPFDECWVEQWPVDERLTAILPSVLTPKGGGVTAQESPKLSQLNGSLGAGFDGARQFRDRMSRFAAVVCAFVAAGLGFVSVRRRRLELSAARHAGVSAIAQLLQLVLETVSWTAAGTATAFGALAVCLWVTEPADTRMLLPLLTRGALASAASLAGVVVAVGLVRERYLFAYFKGSR